MIPEATHVQVETQAALTDDMQCQTLKCRSHQTIPQLM